MSATPFFLIFVIPATVVLGTILGGGWTFLTALVVFVAIPVLDEMLGADPTNPSAEDEVRIRADTRYRALLLAWVPVQGMLTLWAAGMAARDAVTPWEAVGITLSVGLSNGAIGITTAHELAHRVQDRVDRLGAWILLALVGYTHWAIEHVVGHHRWVATPGDPATARLGESFYAFLPRTVAGGARNAWRFEVGRLAQRGVPALDVQNRVLVGALVQAGLLLLFTAAFGSCGFLFFVGQAAVAVVLLEAVNYLEHYGLVRRQVGPDTYEPVSPLHSWNQANRLTNWLLLNLQRHADHHAHPERTYGLLRSFPGSPQLPTGYAGMLLVALVPPLWFCLMDRRVEAWRAARAVGPDQPAV